MKKVKEFLEGNYRILIDIIVVLIIIKSSNLLYGENMSHASFVNLMVILFFPFDLCFLFFKMTNYLKRKFELDIKLLGRHLHFLFYAFITFVIGNKLYVNDSNDFVNGIDLSDRKTLIWFIVIVLLIVAIAVFSFISHNKTNMQPDNQITEAENTVENLEKQKIDVNRNTNATEYIKWIGGISCFLILCIAIGYLIINSGILEDIEYNKAIDFMMRFIIILVLVPILIIATLIVCSILFMAFNMIINSVKGFITSNNEKKDKGLKLSKNYLYLISAFIFIVVFLFVYQAFITGYGNRMSGEFFEDFQKIVTTTVWSILFLIILYFIVTYILVSIVADDTGDTSNDKDKGKDKDKSLAGKIKSKSKTLGEGLIEYCTKLLEGPKQLPKLFSDMLTALCELIYDDETANDKTANDKTANDKTINDKTINDKTTNEEKGDDENGKKE